MPSAPTARRPGRTPRAFLSLQLDTDDVDLYQPSRGLLSGHWSRARPVAGNDFRGHLPRFTGEALDVNLALVDALGEVTREHGASVAQLAITWVLARHPSIVPLVGARTPDRLGEALGALDVELTDDLATRIERAVPPGAVTGTRYDAMGMAILDSER